MAGFNSATLKKSILKTEVNVTILKKKTFITVKAFKKLTMVLNK